MREPGEPRELIDKREPEDMRARRPATGVPRGWPGRRATGDRRESGENGGVAQMGERLLCTQEVVGSIPSVSTRGL